jgi:hypothetical protein
MCWLRSTQAGHGRLFAWLLAWLLAGLLSGLLSELLSWLLSRLLSRWLVVCWWRCASLRSVQVDVRKRGWRNTCKP